MAGGFVIGWVPDPDAHGRPDGVVGRAGHERTLASLWSRIFGLDSVGVQDNFFDLGGHSLMAFRLFAALEQETGITLPLATLFQAPTIERLARLITERANQPPGSRLVPIKSDGSRPPLFLIPGISGTVLTYSALATHLDPEQPAFGIEAVGLDGRQPPLTRIEDMASRYVGEIRSLQPHGPYALAGGSFAGMVAFEMAKQLVAAGERVGCLALFDTYLVGPSVATRLKTHARILATSPPQRKLDYLRERLEGRKTWAARRLRERTLGEEAAGEPPSDAAARVRESNLRAARLYSEQTHTRSRYSGDVTLFVAEDRGEATPHSAEQWDRFVTGHVEKIVVPGTHSTMLQEPHVAVLAGWLDRSLRRGIGQPPPASPG